MERIELHSHTKMTEMAGLMDVSALISQAKEYGMDAVAITDIGNVQAFPEAMDATRSDDDFKMIYGMEATMLDEEGQHYAITILIQNETGRKNLYRLITESYLKYYDQALLIPKEELQKYREGLLIGSAGMDGELYQALNEGEEDENNAKRAKFYDFLEIMPVEAISGLIEDRSIPEDLRCSILQQMNKHLIRAGEMSGVPVCATGDVYYLEKDEMAFRAIMNDSDDKRKLCSKREHRRLSRMRCVRRFPSTSSLNVGDTSRLI